MSVGVCVWLLVHVRHILGRKKGFKNPKLKRDDEFLLQKGKASS